MKICKLMLMVVMCACVLVSCAKSEEAPEVTYQTGYPSGEVQQPQIMYNGEIYYYFATGFSEPLQEGYELVGTIEVVDNLEEPTEDFVGARVEVGQEIYDCEETEDIYIKYSNGYARYQKREEREEELASSNAERESSLKTDISDVY